MTCIAHGNPKPTIQWLMNGEPIESESSLQPPVQYLLATVLMYPLVLRSHTNDLCLWGEYIDCLISV